MVAKTPRRDLKVTTVTQAETLPDTMTDPIPETLVIREAEVLERQATHLVGTLGHVSEGKSTLIRALTGIKTQRHTKEQERNITIHLGYANCRVYQNRLTGALQAVQTRGDPPAGADWFLTAHLSFVDCPGHEAYLATMLGGASVMDTACLIIAANQTVIPQPQTAEHLIAAELMGLERIVVLQNKLDLLTRVEAETNYGAIKAFVAETPAENAPLLPISAQHGWGTQRVLEHLTSLAPPPRDLAGAPRLTCVRSFDVNRPTEFRSGGCCAIAGAVIGGTLERGVLAVGDWLEVRPGVLSADAKGRIQAQPILTRVRGLRCESTELPYAVPGSLIAIATDLDPGLSIANGMVGQRVGVPGSLPPVVGEIVIRLYKLKRDTFPFGKHKVGDRVRVCSNVMTTEATITNIDEKRRLTLQLERPLCLGSGEKVALLRHHKEAGRELLEGTGEVRSVAPWLHVLEAEGIDSSEVAAPNRQIVWEPLERPPFDESGHPASYSALLADVFAAKEDTNDAQQGPTRIRMPEPTLEVLHKHTVWTNWADLVAALGVSPEIPYSDHLLEFVLGDLQTTGSVNAQGMMTMRGRWKLDDARTLIRRYVVGYKRCGQCKGDDTVLQKEGRVLQVFCRRCKAGTVAAQ